MQQNNKKSQSMGMKEIQKISQTNESRQDSSQSPTNPNRKKNISKVLTQKPNLELDIDLISENNKSANNIQSDPKININNSEVQNNNNKSNNNNINNQNGDIKNNNNNQKNKKNIQINNLNLDKVKETSIDNQQNNDLNRYSDKNQIKNKKEQEKIQNKIDRDQEDQETNQQQKNNKSIGVINTEQEQDLQKEQQEQQLEEEKEDKQLSKAAKKKRMLTQTLKLGTRNTKGETSKSPESESLSNSIKHSKKIKRNSKVRKNYFSLDVLSHDQQDMMESLTQNQNTQQMEYSYGNEEVVLKGCINFAKTQKLQLPKIDYIETPIKEVDLQQQNQLNDLEEDEKYKQNEQQQLNIYRQNQQKFKQYFGDKLGRKEYQYQVDSYDDIEFQRSPEKSQNKQQNFDFFENFSEDEIQQDDLLMENQNLNEKNNKLTIQSRNNQQQQNLGNNQVENNIEKEIQERQIKEDEFQVFIDKDDLENFDNQEEDQQNFKQNEQGEYELSKSQQSMSLSKSRRKQEVHEQNDQGIQKNSQIKDNQLITSNQNNQQNEKKNDKNDQDDSNEQQGDSDSQQEVKQLTLNIPIQREVQGPFRGSVGGMPPDTQIMFKQIYEKNMKINKIKQDINKLAQRASISQKQNQKGLDEIMAGKSPGKQQENSEENNLLNNKKQQEIELRALQQREEEELDKYQRQQSLKELEFWYQELCKKQILTDEDKKVLEKMRSMHNLISTSNNINLENTQNAYEALKKKMVRDEKFKKNKFYVPEIPMPKSKQHLQNNEKQDIPKINGPKIVQNIDFVNELEAKKQERNIQKLSAQNDFLNNIQSAFEEDEEYNENNEQIDEQDIIQKLEEDSPKLLKNKHKQINTNNIDKQNHLLMDFDEEMADEDLIKDLEKNRSKEFEQNNHDNDIFQEFSPLNQNTPDKINNIYIEQNSSNGKMSMKQTYINQNNQEIINSVNQNQIPQSMKQMYQNGINNKDQIQQYLNQDNKLPSDHELHSLRTSYERVCGAITFMEKEIQLRQSSHQDISQLTKQYEQLIQRKQIIEQEITYEAEDHQVL